MILGTRKLITIRLPVAPEKKKMTLVNRGLEAVDFRAASAASASAASASAFPLPLPPN